MRNQEYRSSGRWRDVVPHAIPRLIELLNGELDPSGRTPIEARVAILEDGQSLLVQFDRGSCLLGFELRAEALREIGSTLTGARLHLVSRHDLRRCTWKPMRRASE